MVIGMETGISKLSLNSGCVYLVFYYGFEKDMNPSILLSTKGKIVG